MSKAFTRKTELYMNRTTLLPLAFVILLFLPGQQMAMAATIYVSDAIEVALRAGPSNGDKIIRMLQTDDPLDIVQEKENWLLVRTRKGDQGWVPKRYVSLETPKSVQIQKLTKRNEQLESMSGGAVGQIDALQKEKTALRETLAGTQKELQQLKDKYALLESDAANVLTLKSKYTETEDMLKKATDEREGLQKENQELRDSSNLKWFLTGAGVVFLTWLIGFLMGRSKGRQQSSRLH
jgi:SH3 domain protein